MLKFKNIFMNRNRLGIFIPAFFFMIFFIAHVTLKAQVQDCARVLAEAEQEYNAGRFDEAIDLLGSCLPIGFTKEQKKKAYRLLGLNYLAKDYLDKARNAVSKLLDLEPDWEPDPIQDPPPFIQLVEEIKKTIEKQPIDILKSSQPAKKGGGKKILYIASGGALAVAVVGLLLSNGGGNNSNGIMNSKLPNPPGDPSNN